MTLAQIENAARTAGLLTMGALHEDDGTVILLGTGPAFWPLFCQSTEYQDAASHPIDRWSKRVIGALAHRFEGTCQFPSDGPPYPPFIRWAMDSGAFHQSPVGMMAHPDVGLMISLRGALILKDCLPLPAAPKPSPCATCAAPCTTVCPVGALSADHPYDLAACHAYLDTAAGTDCLTRGCLARRACPLSARAKRPDAQSALHMRSFHP